MATFPGATTLFQVEFIGVMLATLAYGDKQGLGGTVATCSDSQAAIRAIGESQT